ncbi:cytoplasmic l-asparaginase i-like protein, putative [Trypanosoma cruzi]|uniref:asparaginase n=1 Tax=Trypanosoma cruzi (strain CL Brener) TaxID=353153 RepID=Q4D990_TRYCC|nr:cytoplasmic l-asparaginase i-like protein, putative [Trypanosoma cruzi]EAN89096.1 cytoplasmic l-asparaginase i-like protein, putative [Trypanosoma cruzi]|eukprot:XP_810947.1 cytoplasmic l-asparaginase i-like protein [Trypanosoma cruzi strain CL Brener]
MALCVVLCCGYFGNLFFFFFAWVHLAVFLPLSLSVVVREYSRWEMETLPPASANGEAVVSRNPILFVSYNESGGRRYTDDLFPRKDRRVLVLYVGGTIGMTWTANGVLEPCKGYLTQVVRGMGELQQRPEIAPFDIVEYDELLDSSDMDGRDYMRIATDVARNYDAYDGFLILHGTDTMHYTASALSFLLMNLAKPVLLTGSMVPLVEPYNDARRNIVVSLMLASNPSIREVCVFFNDCLLRGNCCCKLHHTFGAFCSPNYPVLGMVESTGFHLREQLLLPQPSGPLKVQSNMRGRVVVFALHAECDKKVMKQLLLEDEVAGGTPTTTPLAVQEESPSSSTEGKDNSEADPDNQKKRKNTQDADSVAGDGRRINPAVANTCPGPKKLMDAVLLEIGGVGALNSESSLVLRELASVAKARDIVLCATVQEPFGSLSKSEICRLRGVSPDLIYLHMTTAAAETKLMYLFGKGLSPAAVRKLLPRNLRGEVTPGAACEANL